MSPYLVLPYVPFQQRRRKMMKSINESHVSVSLLLLLFSFFGGCVLCQAKEHQIDWMTPPADNEDMYDGHINVAVGDTITFTWPDPAGFHNVFIHPQLECDMTVDRIRVGETSPATYEFTANDVTAWKDFDEMLFVCDVGRHCERGQKVRVRVYQQQENLPGGDGGGGGSSGNGNVNGNGTSNDYYDPSQESLDDMPSPAAGYYANIQVSGIIITMAALL